MPIVFSQWPCPFNSSSLWLSPTPVPRILQSGYSFGSESPSPTSQQKTLMCFCAHLADRIHHSSVKVYLSAVRSLQIDYGCPDPLSTCLQLQRPLDAVKCNLTELTTRSTSLTNVVSGLACMRTCQDSSCSCATEHGIVFFFVGVFSISISPEHGDSLFDQRSQWFVIYVHVPGFLMLLRHQGANLPQRKPMTADLMGVLH